MPNHPFTSLMRLKIWSLAGRCLLLLSLLMTLSLADPGRQLHVHAQADHGHQHAADHRMTGSVELPAAEAASPLKDPSLHIHDSGLMTSMAGSAPAPLGFWPEQRLQCPFHSRPADPFSFPPYRPPIA